MKIFSHRQFIDSCIARADQEANIAEHGDEFAFLKEGRTSYAKTQKGNLIYDCSYLAFLKDLNALLKPASLSATLNPLLLNIATEDEAAAFVKSFLSLLKSEACFDFTLVRNLVASIHQRTSESSSSV